MIKNERDAMLSLAPPDQRDRLNWHIGCALAAGWDNLEMRDGAGWWWDHDAGRWRWDWSVVSASPTTGYIARRVPDNPGVA